MQISMDDLERIVSELEEQKTAFLVLVDAGMTFEEARIGLLQRGWNYGAASDHIEMLERLTKRQLPGDRIAPMPSRKERGAKP